MPDLQEVFRMSTEKVKPDPGALTRQLTRQRRRSVGKKVGAFAVAAAIVVATVVAILVVGGEQDARTPAGDPTTSSTSTAGAEAVGSVTFDGTACSMEITADRIEPGTVWFELVNATDERVMFDAFQLLDGYTVRAFELKIERDKDLAEAPGDRGTFPSEDEVSYLESNVIRAESSELIAMPMSAGPHAITCMPQQEGEPRFRPSGVAGPILVR